MAEEERFLTYDEILEVLQEDKYKVLLDYGVALILGKNDFKQYLADEGVDFEYTIDENAFTHQNSGISFIKQNVDSTIASAYDAHVLRIEIAFYSKEDLRLYLDKYLANKKLDSAKIQPSFFDKNVPPVFSQADKDAWAKQAELLTPEEKSAMVLYKSSLYEVMSFLWQNYGSALQFDETRLLSILKEKFLFSTLKEQTKYLIDQAYSSWCNAKNNEENKEFFDAIPTLNLDSQEDFFKSIIACMKTFESIDCFTIPRDMTIYRGFSCDGKPESISVTPIASCSPDKTTARKCAFREFAHNHVLLEIQVKKGTPCIPLPFSIKRTTSSIDDKEKYEIKTTGDDIQQEVALLPQKSLISSIEVVDDSNMTSETIKGFDSYDIFKAVRKTPGTNKDRIINEHIKKLIKKRNNYWPITKIIEGSSATLIKGISVSPLQKTDDDEPASE